MNLLSKKILIILSIILILIVGIISWIIFQEIEFPPKGEVLEKEEAKEKNLSLIANISKIDSRKNILIVKPLKEEQELKVILSKNTEIIKLEFPFSLSSPTEKEFTLKRSKIKISQLKEGDTIFIKTNKDISGKTEFNNVDSIEVLP